MRHASTQFARLYHSTETLKLKPMPKDQFPKGDPFHLLEGRDGFHVVQSEIGHILMLSVIAYQGGEPYNMVDDDPNNTSVELLDLSHPTPQERGECERLRLVMDAVCRYFTTGGTWEKFGEALMVARTVIKGGLNFKGYHLSQSYSTTEGDYQHIFVKTGTEEVALWNEPEISDSGLPLGGWIMSTTLPALLKEQENDETSRGPESEETGRTGLRGAIQPPRGDRI